jgi:hypothetical protein
MDAFLLRLRQTCLADGVLVVGMMSSSVAANKKLSWKRTAIMRLLQCDQTGDVVPRGEAVADEEHLQRDAASNTGGHVVLRCQTPKSARAFS